MKNLFKNLMLVAVAAMAFTACTETNDEVNAVSKKTVLNGVVGFAEETRSGFSEETSTNDEGKTVYHSEWDGNESILVVCNGQAKTAPITKNDEGNANFTVEFDGELGDLYYVSVYSPASAFDQSGICTIPSEQTPRANSVDPAAHALSVSSTPVSAGSAYFAMQHSAAYGKMTVKGVEFAIHHVVVDLKGTYYGYDRELSYTINADNVDNNTFWFATEPINVAELTVTAYDAEDNAVANSVTKTVDMTGKEKPLAFGYGQVSTFSVSGLEEYVEPEPEPEPAGPTFTSATVVDNAGPFDQIISFHSDELGTLEVEFYDKNIEVLNDENCLNEGEYSLVQGTRNKIWYANFNETTVIDITITVAWVDGKYHITFENAGGYNDVTFFESATYTGPITGLSTPAGTTPDPETPVDSAMAIKVTDTTVGGFNPYDVTFSFKDGNVVIVRFSTSGNQYLHLGDWQSDSWQEPHFISGAKYNGDNATITACNVASENDAYKVTLTVSANSATYEYTFTGAIQGLYAPEACDCFEEPDPDQPDPDQPEGGDVTEIEISKLYAANYVTDYELNFYIKNNESQQILLDVQADTYNNSGTYSFAQQGDTSNGFAGYSTHQYLGTPIDSGTLVVTVDGSTRTFDFTFMVGGKKYHFNFTA